MSNLSQTALSPSEIGAKLSPVRKRCLKLRVGDWVEVRSKNEILATLDQKGQLDGLPFMPQMFKYCGKRFRVYKRAHKTCDTVFPVRGRRMASAVHLETRCDGEAYGGCQAGCLIFWKEEWLREVSSALGPRAANQEGTSGQARSNAAGCSEADVFAGTLRSSQSGDTPAAYSCQATELPYFTQNLNWWDIRQYIEDFTSGNASMGRILRGLIYSAYNHVINAGVGVGSVLRWVYDKWQNITGGIPYPRRHGAIPVGQKTPTGELGLQPGEWVRVKSYQEILATLDGSNKNRGLYFDAEMVPSCGRTYRVLRRVTRILDEKTGKIQEFKNPCIILQGVACESKYSECRMFCPRGIYSYWREIWLERVENPTSKSEKANRQLEATVS